MAVGTTVMVKLTKMWKNKSLGTVTKLRLMKALVWPVMSYRCEAWTLKLEEEKRIQAFCMRKLLRIPWMKLMTTEQVYKMAGTESDLLSHIKSQKLCYEIGTRQHWRQRDDRSCRGDKKPWKTKDMLDWQHHGVDWPVGTNPSAKLRRRGDMTWHLHLHVFMSALYKYTVRIFGFLLHSAATLCCSCSTSLTVSLFTSLRMSCIA